MIMLISTIIITIVTIAIAITITIIIINTIFITIITTMIITIIIIVMIIVGGPAGLSVRLSSGKPFMLSTARTVLLWSLRDYQYYRYYC